jgi:hypothetical protein
MPGRETVDILEVTPEMAEAWLEKNTRNRSLRESRVVNTAGALMRGEWKLTGDCIVFDEAGELINGQHRLHAIVLSGVSGRLVVLRGVPAENQEVMDQNLSRNLADALKLRGKPYCFALAAALKFFYRLEYIKETGNVNYANPGVRPTTPQCLHLFDQNPEIIDYVPRVGSFNKALKMRTGVTTALWYSFAEINEPDATAFFEALLDGAKLAKQSPILQLRRILINDMVSARPKMRDYREAALICKAWNLYREGNQVGALSWNYGGRAKEAFPIPI